LILGLVAGLITTISMSLNKDGNQEGTLKVLDLKNWMQVRGYLFIFPTEDARPMPIWEVLYMVVHTYQVLCIRPSTG